MEKILGVMAVGFFCLSTAAADALLWQLGKLDGSEAEFHPHYHAWEYGVAPEIRDNPAMDHRTHTYRYSIGSNREIAVPELVSGLATESERHWMSNDEIVSGITLDWRETKAGNRRLELDLINWSNPENGRNGILATLPNGSKKVFNLPDGGKDKPGPVKLAVVFPVRAGENGITIRIVSRAKHYQFQFDRIALFVTDTAPDRLPPRLERAFNAEDGIYTPGQAAKLTILTDNLSNDGGTLNYTVTDAFGKTVAEGTAAVRNRQGILNLPSAAHGYFKVVCRIADATLTTAYVVLEPVKLESLPESRFGCHAINADGYTLVEWPEWQAMTMRRAYLAGAKWVRHHSLHWFLREPKKGQYDWRNFDERLALAEKYKMNLLLTISGMPKWASASTDTRMTCCGTFYYQNYPPKNWQDWADFVGQVVTRYKDRIHWYELWNEPGYTSAFWTNGSAADFGRLLRTGYEAAKKADPGCVILDGAPLAPDFLEEAIRSTGGKPYFDVLSFHYAGSDKRDSDLIQRWKTVLTGLHRSDMPLVNSEEMGWAGGSAPLDFSSTLVKMYVREAVKGIAKTFAFDFFTSGSSFNASAFDIEHNPLPQYAAYRTMTHRLEQTEFVADLSSAETEAYWFDRQGTPVIVVWNDRKQPVSLPLGTPTATVIDIMDNSTPATTAHGIIQLQTSSIPQFIEGGNPTLLRQYSKLLQGLPRKLTLRPGTTAERSVTLTGINGHPQLLLPSGWTGHLSRNKLAISIPKTTAPGFYEVTAFFPINGIRVAGSFLVDVTSGTPGENLLFNGDFRQSTCGWFFPPTPHQFTVIEKAGVDGKAAACTHGTVFFGNTGSIKVRRGEKYVLLAEARGAGSFGGVYSLTNRKGKEVFPVQQGINCLTGQLTDEWKTFTEVIAIDHPEAAELHFSVLANYDDKKDKAVYFNRLEVVRLSDQLGLNQVIWQGVGSRLARAPTEGDWSRIPPMTADRRDAVCESDRAKWSGTSDLSASCRLALDAKFLYLRFDVRDDVFCPPAAHAEHPWKNDSIQLAFDPKREGKDCTEILIAGDASGHGWAYKETNFWTPEIPENLTRRGIMPDTQVTATPVPGGRQYRITIPLRELYPLTAKTAGFGFSWLVNDNDGQGRKYIQWSGGIGGNKDAALFGLVKIPLQQDRK